MTVFEQIADAALAALNTGRPSGIPEHHEWTGVGVEHDQLPAATVLWGKQKSERVAGRAGPLTKHVAPLHIEYLTSNVAQTAPAPAIPAQRAAEPLRAWAVAKLSANRLGGLAIDVEELETDRKPEQGEYPFARTVVSFAITYTTRVADAEQRV